MIYHCLFEQSGTFKNVIKRCGGQAKDYDILNDYGETDVQIDLFEQIDRAYLGINSIFDKIKPDDFILAFFPCTRFENQCNMLFLGNAFKMKNWSDEKKLNYDLYLHSQLTRNYELVTKLALVALRKKIPLIIENPMGKEHYLTRYWAIKPKVIEMNRAEHGDHYKKPTQFWFINCDPKNNLIFKNYENHYRGRIEDVTKDRAKVRSEIHSDYAEWFLMNYVFDDKFIQEITDKEYRSVKK